MEMDPEEERRQDREPEHVQAIKTEERLASHVRTAAYKGGKLRPEDRHRAEHVGPHHRCPVRLLVPGQEVTGETERQRHREQQGTRDPSQFPGIFVGTGDEDPDHMEQHHHNHEIRGPLVHRTEQASQGHDLVQALDAGVRLRLRWVIVR